MPDLLQQWAGWRAGMTIEPVTELGAEGTFRVPRARVVPLPGPPASCTGVPLGVAQTRAGVSEFASDAVLTAGGYVRFRQGCGAGDAPMPGQRVCPADGPAVDRPVQIVGRAFREGLCLAVARPDGGGPARRAVPARPARRGRPPFGPMPSVGVSSRACPCADTGSCQRTGRSTAPGPSADTSRVRPGRPTGSCRRGVHAPRSGTRGCGFPNPRAAGRRTKSLRPRHALPGRSSHHIPAAGIEHRQAQSDSPTVNRQASITPPRRAASRPSPLPGGQRAGRRVRECHDDHEATSA